MYGIITYEDNYLVHHGIKGQKWGVRRFQNEDGTLTEAGKKHYNISDGGNRKLDRKFHRDMNKLRKIDENADISVQKAKYKHLNEQAKKEAKSGIALASATVLGNTLVNKIANDIGTKRARDTGTAFAKVKTNDYFKDKEAGFWAKYYANGAAPFLLGAAGYKLVKAGVNKAQAQTAKYRATEEGNAKELAKRKAQYNKMYNTYKDTPYLEILKKRA